MSAFNTNRVTCSDFGMTVMMKPIDELVPVGQIGTEPVMESELPKSEHVTRFVLNADNLLGVFYVYVVHPD